MCFYYWCCTVHVSQVQDGHTRVLDYGSCTLNKAECNYCITDKELLAVRYIIEYYRQYLLGRTLMSEQTIKIKYGFFSLKEPKDRVAGWIEIVYFSLA